MKATLYIIECDTEAGGRVTHYSGSVEDARYMGRELSLLHKSGSATMSKWQFFGKGKDVAVAIAASLHLSGHLDSVSEKYSGATTSKLVETLTFRRGRKHKASGGEPALEMPAN